MEKKVCVVPRGDECLLLEWFLCCKCKCRSDETVCKFVIGLLNFLDKKSPERNKFKSFSPFSIVFHFPRKTWPFWHHVKQLLFTFEIYPGGQLSSFPCSFNWSPSGSTWSLPGEKTENFVKSPVFILQQRSLVTWDLIVFTLKSISYLNYQ